MISSKRGKSFVIYTAIFGDRDELIEPSVFNDNCDYVCFTDKNIKSKTYRIVKLDNFFQTPRLDSKFFKVMSHIIFPQYKYSIWIDGSIFIKSDPYEYYLSLLMKNDICLFPHRLRNNVYSESRYCIKHKFDKSDVILAQMNKYVSAGYPAKNGLFENGVIARVNNLNTAVINTEWWNEIRSYSIRDQISLPYVLWKNKVEPYVMTGTVYKNNFFEVRKHQL